MENKRTAYQIIEGEEVEIPFSEIKKGMKVKLYEPDGEVVVDREGNKVFNVDHDVYTNDEGILTFETKE